MYTLSLDQNFAPFLDEHFRWNKKSAADPHRGLASDDDNVPEDRRRTATQKTVPLELMLGQIANFCPVVSRNTIVKTAESLRDIWQRLRQHYGFQSSGAHFLDLSLIKYELDESPEDLFQRIMAFFEDNLLGATGNISHHGQRPIDDEEVTPSVENTVVFLWLQLINPALPQLVKQRYGAELRNKTLASIRPEISQALTSLLEELKTVEESRAMRFSVPSSKPTFKKSTFKLCVLCKTAGRQSYSSHNLIECKFLPEKDRRMFARTRLVQGDESVDEGDGAGDCDDEEAPPGDCALLDTHTARRVNIVQSPYLTVYYGRHPVRLTIDTGATTNMVKGSFARLIGLPVSAASQMARQADGVTPLNVVGEVHCYVTRKGKQFALDALVVERLDVEVLAGSPFMVTNDIATRPARQQIVIDGSEIVYYGSQSAREPTIRRTQSFLLRNAGPRQVVLPGEFIELSTPEHVDPDCAWALEPRVDVLPTSKHLCGSWPPPQEVQAVGGSLRIPNDTDSPILIRHNDHICQVNAVVPADNVVRPQTCLPPPEISQPLAPYATGVSLDPDGILTVDERAEFAKINHQFDHVFQPEIGRYNGASGAIEGRVNMGPVLPPQRKGRLPQYNRGKLDILQAKFDELEAGGVFAKPEDVGVPVEYLNLSFLVKKPSGGHRLVTAFGEVGQYTKPQPSLMPCVDGALSDIARWKYLIKTDLLKSFYQIPLARESMKFCGVATPYKGIRVYTRCAMGMPGSETALEELMCRILGSLVQQGVVAKLADDLYCGGETVRDALENWSRVLAALDKNGMKLSAAKTVICPKTTDILGWVWSQGTLRAGSHRVAVLASTDPPQTVRALRSFIGAYKVLSRVLKGYADLLHPLEQVVAGKQSNARVAWNEGLLQAFNAAKVALGDNKTITLPLPGDALWIVTDAAVKSAGIGATLYVMRDEHLCLAGFFNAKLRKHQVTWLPCEVEALCIGAAVRHFAPYIIQSAHTTSILTDSRPCVQAYEKLCRGEFSASSRVTTFLSIVSRYQVKIAHVSGAANLPSDFASRNPNVCADQSCQVCKFCADTEDSVVAHLSVSDVCDAHVPMPFTNRAAWISTQLECPDLRRVHSQLGQGTRPSKKMTDIPDFKRYLRSVTIARDGLLVVREDRPLAAPSERIVVPRGVIDGLLTAIHIRFNHPSQHQMKRVAGRYFFALDLEKAIHSVVAACHHCASLKNISGHVLEQSTMPPPERLGVFFAADIMRRCRQYLLVLRETMSSYTRALLVADERGDTLRAALLTLAAEFLVHGGAALTIRVDPAPAFVSLVSDPVLLRHGVRLDIGLAKNPNKNPVAERAIEELSLELLHLAPEGGPVSQVTLSLAVASMNSRVRGDGLSSWEVWTQRDQVTGDQLPVDDRQLIVSKIKSRVGNHAASAKSKAPGRAPPPVPSLEVGDLVYLRGDRDKTKARDRYMVVGVAHDWCKLRKFTKCQYRSKTYDVRISDCYPVPPTTLSHSPVGPVKGFGDRTESEGDIHRECPTFLSSHQLMGIPVSPPVIVAEPVPGGVGPDADPPDPGGQLHDAGVLGGGASSLPDMDHAADPMNNDIVEDGPCPPPSEQPLRRSSRVTKGKTPLRFVEDL